MHTTPTRSQPLSNEALHFSSAKPAPRIGMDMAPPYGVYVDGSCVAEYVTEEAASRHFNQLCGRGSPIPPRSNTTVPLS